MSSPYDEIRDVVETAMFRCMTLRDVQDIVEDAWESALERKREQEQDQGRGPGFYDASCL